MNLFERSDAVIREPAGAANAAVIWLHGLGADGHDFAPVVPALKLPAGTAVRYLFPHAPVRPVTLNGGLPMRAWYDIVGLRREDPEDEAGIRASAAALMARVAGQIEAGIPASRIVIAGFSQGGAIALHAGLRLAEPLAGVMALSTYLPLAGRAAAELTAAGRATPVLACHGRDDGVLGLHYGTGSRDALRALGCTVEWHDYPMDHAVCPEEIEDIRRWLSARLPAPQGEGGGFA